jgi:hypothetical protein
MISHIIRLVKRFAVLIPGIIIAYVSVHTIYPLFDQQVPAAVAIFLTYVLAAYILIPALIRFLRIFIRPKHLPHYCVTPDGFASDPINIGLIGTREALVEKMETAGWFLADSHNLRNVVRQILSFFTGYPYPRAPMSSLYLFGRGQDLGFELAVKGKRGHRHHVRFWATVPGQNAPWVTRKKDLGNGELLWIGAASRDVGLALIRHNAQITHMVAPDTDAERELIISHLKKVTPLQHIENIRVRPYRLGNRAWRAYLQSDGVVKIYKL